ncbi:hypothetical protein EVAR_99284_1 [Eumeta japonica]|uniref:Histone-lysine N-methyltransferase SETMAR n=1 Tax=Eumeta variegata TaxID=151549 RepID=A0A4C1ZCQ5_EUMVA|nr:hypothetical protein EVAR_99284_1 [Eumeta japonica]
MSAVRVVIEADKRVTYQQIRTGLGVGTSRVHQIHKHLAVMKLGTRRIPYNLTEAQKLGRVDRCRETMQRFASDDSRLKSFRKPACSGVWKSSR